MVDSNKIAHRLHGVFIPVGINITGKILCPCDHAVCESIDRSTGRRNYINTSVRIGTGKPSA